MEEHCVPDGAPRSAGDSGAPRAAPGRASAREPGEIPNYELLGLIGVGGFGEVWLARERLTDLRRAVKVLYKEAAVRAAREIEGVRRYQQSAHDHPNLLQILTVGENERCYYYVMEAADDRLDGAGEAYAPATLRTQMQQAGRSEPRDALVMTAKLLAGVRRLHEQGLVHCDLKPENVIIVGGEPKIGDVSLVSHVGEGSFSSGSPAYMTPELRSDDLYAVGKILYESITALAASDFPSLPPALLARPSVELSASIRIINRACHSTSGGRFGNAAEFEKAVASVRHPVRPTRRILVVVAAALVVLLGTVISLRNSRFADERSLRGSSTTPPVPKVLSEYTVEPNELASLRPVRFLPDPWKQQDAFHPYLRLGREGPATAAAGMYVWPLAAEMPHFQVEYHLRSIRPWGNLLLGIGANPEGGDGVWLSCKGQPHGLGLRIGLHAEGVSEDPAPPGQVPQDMLPFHPQPGITYVLRVACCRESVEAAIWPVASSWREPQTIRTRRLLRAATAPAYLWFSSTSGDERAAVELLDLRVTSFDQPPEHVDLALLKSTLAQETALIPELKQADKPPRGDLIAAFDPYTSDYWMSIGPWAWWGGESPTPTGRRKTVWCKPFSFQEQRDWGLPCRYFAGEQMLRFDGAEYGDFIATLHVDLGNQDDKDDAAFNPLLCLSEDGMVGLAFRMQEQTAPGCDWGPGYTATVSIPSDRHREPRATIARRAGWALGYDLNTLFTVMPIGESPVGAQAGVGERSSLLPPRTFVLRLEARGNRFTLSINGSEATQLECSDPESDYLASGRIALVAGKVLAAFKSLEITPLESGE